MGFKKNTELPYNIEEFIGAIKESPKSDWCKAILRMTWGDNPTTIDIRNIKMGDTKIIGKGISLSNEEADRLIKILLDNGFGNLEDLEDAIKKKRSFFTLKDDSESMYDEDEDDGMMHIDINL